MAVGSFENDYSTLRLGNNVQKPTSVYAAAGATVTVLEGDILARTANGYEIWNGTDAVALRVAEFALTIDNSGGGSAVTETVQAVSTGEVDASMLRVGGVLGTTEVQEDLLRDYNINAIAVNDQQFPGDSAPTEV